MLLLALGNLFFILNYLAQPKYNGRTYCNLICYGLLIPEGGLPLSEQKKGKSGLGLGAMREGKL